MHPLAAVLVGDTVYVIDSGKLKALDRYSASAPQQIAPPDGRADTYPIQELAALAYLAPAKTVFLLDRSGAVYGWDLNNRWWLERRPGGSSDYSQEYPVDLVADSQTVYLLDTNNGRIWKRNTGGWAALVTNEQLKAGIRLAYAGDLFVLVGERPGRPARLLRLRGTALSEVALADGMDEPTVIASGSAGSLLLVDRGFGRLRLADVATGKTRPIAVAGGAAVSAVASDSQGTVLLGSGWMVTVRGPLPDDLRLRITERAQPVGWPNNPATLAALPRLRMPVAGAHLPDIDRSLPGAPRPYRIGVHEGIDLYSSTAGVPVVKGTAVLSAGDGMVIRADVDYREATAAEMEQWLAQCRQEHMTPAWIQDKLGGRQVWIDHGNGISTRYLHLSGIAPGIAPGVAIKAGDIIAYAGNSGTPEAAAGLVTDVHLHVEVRIGNSYLGCWISPIETRRALWRMFGSP